MSSPSPPPPPPPVAEGQGQPQEEPVTHVWGESLQRLCADAKASPLARLEPRLAVPCAYQVCEGGTLLASALVCFLCVCLSLCVSIL